MTQHGQIDKNKNLVYCGYWMTFDEWEEIHKYNPDSKVTDNNEDPPLDDQQDGLVK